jgi:Fe2+ or Zn2+ uptake regulation protein
MESSQSDQVISLLDQLKTKQYKMTKARRLVVEALVQHQNRYMTVEDIYLWVKERYPSVNLTTIYRNLEAVEAIGELDRALFSEQVATYKLNCQHSHHHHHMICTVCGKIIAIDFCPVAELRVLAKKHKFTMMDHRMEIFGTCAVCSETQ